MTTIKSFTDINQSKKLAKILPIESADMYWQSNLNSSDRQYLLDMGEIEYFDIEMNFEHYNIGDYDIPAWSLAALLEQLKAEIQLENKQILFLHINKYDDIDYEIRYTNSWTGEVFITEADNLVDACVTMIEKLHKLNML